MALGMEWLWFQPLEDLREQQSGKDTMMIWIPTSLFQVLIFANFYITLINYLLGIQAGKFQGHCI